jgi:two-component SAPR family response regulator
MKFIVVDDEEVNFIFTRRLLKDVLKVEEISTYQNAGEALRFLKNYAVKQYPCF